MLVEISGNGTTWTEIARHNTDGGLSWRHNEITQADLDNAGVTLTATMQLRFTANDDDPPSINESGLDAFVVTAFDCQFANYPVGDLNCDGVVDLFDIDAFVLALTSATDDPPFAGYYATYPDCNALLADTTNDGTVNLFDIDPFVGLLTGP